MSLWLSRLLLATAPRPRDVHGVLWRAFPGERKRAFLYRADEIEGGRLRLLVQSTAMPTWDRLGDSLEELAGPKPFAPAIEAGRRFRFFLRANPTVSRKGRAEPRFAALTGEAFRAERGRRVGIVREEERVAWLAARGVRAGFRVEASEDGVLSLRVAPPFVSRWRHAGQTARHDGVDFEGLLVVQDAGLLSRALAAGIGAGKAFGFGLLSLAALP